jgi:aspartyl/asparaginyl beta-hydroxylase (cupin superfamily)
MRPAFYSIEDFPQLHDLTQHWQTIREEFLALKAPLLELDRVDKDHAMVHAEMMEHLEGGGEYGWLMGWDNDGTANLKWLQYALTVFGSPIPFAVPAMPRTIELITAIPGIRTSALLTLKPHTLLSAHKHETLHDDGVLLYHLTLDVPHEGNFAYLGVEGEIRQNQLGSGMVFDGSLDHFAFNAGTQDRTILYMEFEAETLRAK